jgi:hypothetical protein
MRSARRKLGALIGAAAIVTGVASACGPTPTPPPAAKADFSFEALTLKAPGAGINFFENASISYSASNVPKDATIVLQLETITGKAISWTAALNLPRQPLGRGVLQRPPFGRDTYRIAVLDHAGKVLTAKAHTLDVYEHFSLGLLTNRPRQFTPFPKFPNEPPFRYYFQDAIHFPRTSCRTLNEMEIYNKDVSSRLFQVVERQPGGKTRTENHIIDPGVTLFGTGPIQPGDDLDLHVADNDDFGLTMFVQGNAVCFTGNGNY